MKTSKIPDLLEKVSAIVQSSSFPNVSSLERDLLLQHLRDMYDETLSLNNTTTTTSVVETPVKKMVSETTIAPAFFNKKTLHSNENLLIEEVAPIAEVKALKVEEVITKTEVKTEAVIKTSTINERTPASGSLNQKLKGGNGKEVYKILSTKPLRELIDLNKKFALVNELFKGNSESFTVAVNQIDSFQSFEDAQNYIASELSSKNQWDTTSQPSRLFLSLVKQRFGVE